MKIIAKGTLREFWEQNPDAETGLRFWYAKISKNNWNNPNDVMAGFNGADTVGNGRIVFNISKNNYRLIVFFRYDIQIAYIRFMGLIKNMMLSTTSKPSDMMNNMLIKPIKNADHYKQVMAQIELLLDSPTGSPQADLLEVLSILADDYENKTIPILPPDPIEAIRYQASELGLSSAELAALLGGKNRLSEVMNRKRPLTLKMIKTLYRQLQIPADSLLAV